MTNTVLTNSTVNRIISTMGEMPASPAIMSAVMGLTSNLDTGVEQLEKVLSADQTLTAKVLKLSNSSFYGRPKGVSTLKEAILILGFHTLRSLVIASSTHSLYKKKNENKIEQKLWEHSLATAIACKMVARKIHHSQIEETFIAGLMHDLGKLILSQKLTDVYFDVYKEVERNKARFIDVEKERLDFCHTDVAQVLLTQWNYPPSLTRAIYNHHTPENDSEEEATKKNIKNIPIAYIVHFCNQLAKYIGCDFNDHREEDLSILPLAQIAGFQCEEIDELIENLKEVYQSEKHLFDE